MKPQRHFFAGRPLQPLSALRILVAKKMGVDFDRLWKTFGREEFQPHPTLKMILDAMERADSGQLAGSKFLSLARQARMGRILAIGKVGRLARKAAQKGDAATLGKITQAVAAAAANETHSVNQMVVCIAFDELYHKDYKLPTIRQITDHIRERWPGRRIDERTVRFICAELRLTPAKGQAGRPKQPKKQK
jgi:hypothetical protein